MTKPLFLLFSLLLTGAVVVFVGWQALFGITLLSFCTLLFSSEPGQQAAPAPESVAAVEAPAFAAMRVIDEDEEGIEEAIDEAGWYYPLADQMLALSAANETSFGNLEPGPAQVAFNAAMA